MRPSSSPVEHVFFAVEHPGRTGEAEALLAGDLADGAAGREVAPQDRDVASGLHGAVERRDHVLVLGEVRALSRFSPSVLPVTVSWSPSSMPFVEQVPHHAGHATDRVQILHHVLARRLEVGQQRHSGAGRQPVVDRQLELERPSHGDECAARRWSNRRAPSSRPLRSRATARVTMRRGVRPFGQQHLHHGRRPARTLRSWPDLRPACTTRTAG